MLMCHLLHWVVTDVFNSLWMIVDHRLHTQCMVDAPIPVSDQYHPLVLVSDTKHRCHLIATLRSFMLFEQIGSEGEEISEVLGYFKTSENKESKADCALCQSRDTEGHTQQTRDEVVYSRRQQFASDGACSNSLTNVCQKGRTQVLTLPAVKSPGCCSKPIWCSLCQV